MNLIYQFWNGTVPNYAHISSKVVKEYAERIGADYKFANNEKFISTTSSEYFNCLRPIYDKTFHDYEKVLFLDMDIFVVDQLKENVFDIDVKHIGMAREPHQPEIRYSNTGRISGQADERWADVIKKKYNSVIPRDDQNRLLVFNSGVVLYSNEGLQQANKHFKDVNEYGRFIRSSGLDKFYTLDQNYINTMVFTPEFEFTELDCEWNRQLYFLGKSGQANRPIYDHRNKDTKFIHNQLRGVRHSMDEKLAWQITNLPQSEWER